MTAPQIQASDALVQLGNLWQQLHDEQMADNNQFSNHMQTSAVAMQSPQTGQMLQHVGNSIQSLNHTSSHHFGGIGTGHTQAHVTLTNADDEGGNIVGQVMTNLA